MNSVKLLEATTISKTETLQVYKHIQSDFVLYTECVRLAELNTNYKQLAYIIENYVRNFQYNPINVDWENVDWETIARALRFISKSLT